MKLYVYILTAILTLTSVSANAAPVLFNNVMSFDNNQFGLVDFDATDQDTVPEINTYLSSYNSSLTISSGSIVTSQSYAHSISPSLLLYGSSTTFTVTFNDPVNAAGAFLLGMEGNQNPYSGGVGCYITVWLANGGGYYQYDYRSLLTTPPTAYYVNGFFGVFEQEHGIEKIEIKWNRDAAGMDNFYFSDTLTSVNNGGPKNIPFSQIYTIELPTYGTPPPPATPVPEPTTLVLLGMAIVPFLKRTIRK